MNSVLSQPASDLAGKTEASLFQIVYVSAATKPFTSDELVALLDRSRANNARVAVTGMLLYHDGNFMQVLEGREADVLQVYERISRDPRHKRCLILTRQAVAERTFGDWSMGFRDSRSPEVRTHEGYSSYLNPGASLPQDPSRAWKLLSSFRQSVR